MNPSDLAQQLTEEQRQKNAESRAALEASVEELRSRPHFEEPERIMPSSDPKIFDLATVMPGVISLFERMQKKSEAFREGIRPQFLDAPDSIACPKHHSVRLDKLWEETCQKSWKNEKFTAAYAPCPECLGERSEAARRGFWQRRGVPERVISASFDNFTADGAEKREALENVQDWIRRNGVFLVLRGTPGTGKGHLATSCLKAQGNGLFITHADMLADLRASYTLKTTPALLEGWQEAEMFVLDEFGLSPGGNDEETMLYQVLADRHDKRRPTIITTNLEREAFSKAIGFRLIDRIGEDCAVVPCCWESHRRAKK